MFTFVSRSAGAINSCAKFGAVDAQARWRGVARRSCSFVLVARCTGLAATSALRPKGTQGSFANWSMYLSNSVGSRSRAALDKTPSMQVARSEYASVQLAYLRVATRFDCNVTIPVCLASLQIDAFEDIGVRIRSEQTFADVEPCGEQWKFLSNNNLS